MASIRRCVRVRSMLLILALGLGVQTVAAAEVQYPLSIAVTETGVVYLADRNLPGVWKLEGENLTVFFEGSKKFRTPLNAVRCVAVDREGKVWAGDSATREVYRLDGAGQAMGLTQKSRPQDPATEKPTAEKPTEKEPPKTTDTKDKKVEEPKPVATEPDPKATPAAPQKPPFIHGEIGIPMDIAFAKNGDLYVSDLEIHRIMKVDKEGGTVKEFVTIQAPRGLCFDDQDNLWVVSGRRLVKVSPAGEKTTVVEEGSFEYPHTVAIGADQSAYVCDGYAKAIWKVPPGGKPEKFVSGEPLVSPVGMRLVKDKIYVVDPRAKAMFQITLDKQITTVPLKAKAS
jgi:hypothetical protein